MLRLQVLPAALRDDLDALAGHFWDAGQFETLFIGNLVPWDNLTGRRILDTKRCPTS